MRFKMVRWPVLPVLLAVLVLATASVAVAENSRSGSGVVAAAPAAVAPMPGTDPAMQRWFLAVDKARIAFNNVLLRAEADIAGGAGVTGRASTAAGQAGTANCSALVAATALITKALPVLAKIPAGGQAVADAYGPSLAQFAAAGQACVKRDFTGAQNILGNTLAGAIAEYGVAQERRRDFGCWGMRGPGMTMAGRSRVRRLAAGMAAVLALTVVIVADVSGFTPASAGSAPTPGGINAIEDTYVSGASADSNNGTSPVLVANATGPVYTHLKFVVTGSNGATSATLQVYSTSSGSVKTAVFAEPATWTETGLTYNLQPAKGTWSSLGSLSTLVANNYSTLTVPLTGDGTYAFVLTTSASAARNMTSRETGTPPQLVLSSTPPTTTAPRSNDPVIAAAGDIGCAANDPSFNSLNGTATACRSRYTEQLIKNINPLYLLPLGDEQYNSGSTADFNASYAKTWGQSVGISMPVVGNHEYGTTNAGGYFTFFTNRPTGGSGKGYYSYDVGAWHVVAINTECTRIDKAVGCAVGSPQETWLKNDLAKHPTKCTLVYGHRPRWASSSFASADIAPLIVDMVAGGVDLYLTGHAHSYERFAPQNANGAQNANGLTQLTVGTGGAFYTGNGTVAANSMVRAKNLYGVEKLVLHPTSWDYSFVPENSSFGDTGTGTCH